eukprot:6470792-Pyramimonas_sp.AAC.1
MMSQLPTDVQVLLPKADRGVPVIAVERNQPKTASTTEGMEDPTRDDNTFAILLPHIKIASKKYSYSPRGEACLGSEGWGPEAVPT